MKKHPAFPIPLTKSETVYGICWLFISSLLLPSLISLGNTLLGSPLSTAKLNFVYFFINFAVTVWILRRFLLQSWRIALKIPMGVIWFAILGYLGYQVLTNLVTYLIYYLSPEFFNANDQSVYAMLDSDFTLMAVGTVLLAPVAEELLYRGVVFRGLYDKSPAGAWAASILLFAAAHVVGYIGVYSPLQLMLAFLQYIPAGYALCFVYRRTGTIVTPMLMHVIVNAMSVYYAVR